MQNLYPIDAPALLRRKRQIKRELLEAGSGHFLKKKIAVLGGSTTNEIVEQLDLFLLASGIQADFYQSDFGMYWQDAVLGNPRLASFEPDVAFIHTNWRNIGNFPKITDKPEDVEALLQNEYGHFKAAWDALREKHHCQIIQNNFERPAYRLLGNRDIYDCRGKSNFISRLNQKFYQYAQGHEDFHINDLDYLAADFGLEAWGNPQFWYMYRYCLSLEAIPHLAHSVASIIKSLFGKNKKALALDLDNTLWGGIVGDDGVEKLQLGADMPMGEAFLDFQRYLKELKSLGILLTIDSKNEHDNALAGLRHPDAALHPEDFAAIQANWDSKDKNLIEIARQLNLDTSSFVFVDDNPAERELIQDAGLGVETPPLDKVESYISIIDKAEYFEASLLSEDDMRRAEMYREEQQRQQLRQSTLDYGAFLNNLEMRAVIRPFEANCIPRIAQLVNKSNQFNLTTLRCTESDIRQMAEDKNWLCLYGKLTDRFGDNGLVSVVAGETLGEELHIRLWLMSCRVLKREFEYEMLNVLAAKAAEMGIKSLLGYYYPTAKNGMVSSLYQEFGFSKLLEDSNGTQWKLELENFTPFKTHISINKEEL